jgi:anti-sigma regulatory factor (Ser/Thr protein kinase)
MANPIEPALGAFHTELDDGQVVEIDGGTIRDQETGATRPAVLLRMTPERAHVLAHVLGEWARTALIYATLSSSEPTERTLALTGPVRRVFPGDNNQVAAAHDLVRRVLADCPVLDEAVLLTSELCANALQHSASGNGGNFEVTVRGHEFLRIEVYDDGSETAPTLPDLDEGSESGRGRGRGIVALFAHKWGQAGDEYGRSVFFELRW